MARKKTTLRFSQKVENFDQKFAFYNWWRRFLRKVSVYENFEVFCTLHATFQVWAINQQLRKTFFHFFFLFAFSLKMRGVNLRQRLRRSSCVCSAFRKWFQKVWQRNPNWVAFIFFQTTNSKPEFAIKPANVKCRLFMEFFIQDFQSVEPVEICTRVL